MRQFITNYTYNPVTGLVTLTDFGTVRLDRLETVINTTRGVVLYGVGGITSAATVSTNTVTVPVVQSSGWSSGDSLLIVYDTLPADPLYAAVKTDGTATTQPVSAAALPLPAGAAAESGGNLASIASNTGRIPAQGQALAAASTPVVLTAAQVTTLTPPTAITQSGTWTFGKSSDYPAGATAIAPASGSVANANAVATLAGVSAKTTYITGFEITSSGATVGTVVTITVTGTITGTLTYIYAAPAGVLLMGTPLFVEFSKPIPASAANTAIVVTLPALGTGNTNAAVVAHGYQL